MNNILVIGGAGFIGSHISEILSKDKKNNVIILDNLFLGREDNLERFKDRIRFIEGDYSDKKVLDKIFSENKIDHVFHFAGFSSAPHYYGNESEGFSIGVVGFINLMDACKEHGVKRIMYASTSSLYSGVKKQEESAIIEPIDFYTLTKYSMEHVARIYNKLYGVESIGFRFFSVYGLNEKHKGRFANLISQFYWAMKKEDDVVFYGDGNQTRDFTYVIDICNAMIAGMDADRRFAQGNVYNIGTSKSYSLNEMVDILERITGLKAIRKYIDNPIKNYVRDTKASNKKIKDELGFVPSFDLEMGIKDILDHDFSSPIEKNDQRIEQQQQNISEVRI